MTFCVTCSKYLTKNTSRVRAEDDAEAILEHRYKNHVLAEGGNIPVRLVQHKGYMKGYRLDRPLGHGPLATFDNEGHATTWLKQNYPAAQIVEVVNA